LGCLSAYGLQATQGKEPEECIRKLNDTLN